MSEEDTVVQQFLGDRPNAEQFRDWRVTLERRLQAMVEDRKSAEGPAAASLDARITQLKRQVAALQEEEAVTQFVEDSVRVTLAMGAVTQGPEIPEE